MGNERAARRPEYEDYAFFQSKYFNACSRCSKDLPVDTYVYGRRLDGGGWDIVCLDCGSYTTPAPSAPNPLPPKSGSIRPLARRDSPDGTRTRPNDWSRLVDYLRSCVEKESLLAPVPLNQRDLWTVLPVGAETVLCGNDLTLPLLPELQVLFKGLEQLEGVFYGWPTVVVLDDRQQPFVAPLFVRQLKVPGIGDSTVSVEDLLPRVNTGLLGMKWFSPEVLASAAAAIAGKAVGFGIASAVINIATHLLKELGVPLTDLDPANLIRFASLGDPWRPQEVGVFNMAMAFKGKLDGPTRSLIEDLQWIAKTDDWGASAAKFLLQDAPVPSLAPLMSCAVALNDSQQTALAWAASAPLTVITGPPGTGKSQTVTAILAEAWRRGETALLASTNNAPVDDVINTKAAMVDEALVLRTGNADKRRELGGWLREWVGKVSTRTADERAAFLKQNAGVRQQAVHALQQHAEVSGTMLNAAIRRDETRARLWGQRQGSPDASAASIRSRAKRAAKTRWRWLQRRRADRLRALIGVQDPAVTAQQILDWVVAEDSFDSAKRSLAAFLDANRHNLIEAFERDDQRWQAASVAAVRNRVTDSFATGAELLTDLADTLADKPPHEAIARAMVHVKGWATSALSTRPNFKCSAGVIDLVVIDEASQCNLAQVLPLAYRAKRLVIVGDPKQLRPVVTSSPEELHALAVAAGLQHDALADAHQTYGKDSAYTAFAARVRPGPLLLDEHYRCHPEIIRYCNEQFYDNKLTVLTAVDRDGDPERGLEWRDVAGRTEPGRTGSSFNQAEAEAVVAWVVQSGLEPDRIGIVTPFKAQVAKIQELLRRQGNGRFTEIRVGTAHTFQGGERDTIVFSTVISDGAQDGTIGWLEGERNLINVAVSRARRHLVVFGNRAELKRRNVKTLLGLAEAAGRTESQTASVSPAVTRLHTALIDSGLPASLGQTEEGYLLTIALTALNGDRINIEIDEFPEGDLRGRRQRQLATRDANVERLGWRVMRKPGWQAYLDPDAIVKDVQKLFYQHTDE